MNKNNFRSAFLALIAVAVMAGAGSPLYGMDSNGRYFAYGVGERHCEDYIKFREKRLETLENHERYTKDELYEIVDKIVEHWIAGFLTAHNYYVTDTYDVIGKTTLDEVKIRLEKTCRAAPQKYFAQAVVEIAQELHPNRVKAEAAAAQKPSGR
jgi:hypothetical protein